MASGNNTSSASINVSPDGNTSFRTIAEYAKAAGLKVGIVTTVSPDHATPAGFYAKVLSCSDYYGAALQLASSGFDYFAGGGFLYSPYLGMPAIKLSIGIMRPAACP